MKFEIGDKVLVEGVIRRIDVGKPEYLVVTKCGNPKWVYEDEIRPMPAKDINVPTYEDGMRDAWEMAKKIVSDITHGGYSTRELVEIFGAEYTYGGSTKILHKLTATEAAEKITAWEESKRIHVGDVVEVGEKGTESYTGTAVVTNTFDDSCYLLFTDGESEIFENRCITKTGRRVDIASLLSQIGGQDE